MNFYVSKQLNHAATQMVIGDYESEHEIDFSMEKRAFR